MLFIFVILLTFFGTTTKETWRGKNLANMNKEKAYTKYICGTLYTDATSMYTVIQQVYLHR